MDFISISKTIFEAFHNHFTCLLAKARKQIPSRKPYVLRLKWLLRKITIDTQKTEKRFPRSAKSTSKKRLDGFAFCFGAKIDPKSIQKGIHAFWHRFLMDFCWFGGPRWGAREGQRRANEPTCFEFERLGSLLGPLGSLDASKTDFKAPNEHETRAKRFRRSKVIGKS